jgi:hypothetical protein
VAVLDANAVPKDEDDFIPEEDDLLDEDDQANDHDTEDMD